MKMHIVRIQDCSFIYCLRHKKTLCFIGILYNSTFHSMQLHSQVIALRKNINLMIPRHRTDSKALQKRSLFRYGSVQDPKFIQVSISFSISSQEPKVYYRNGYITLFTTITKVVIILGKLLFLFKTFCILGFGVTGTFVIKTKLFKTIFQTISSNKIKVNTQYFSY